MEYNHSNSAILGLDIGSVRIGIALSSRNNYLIRPLTTLVNDQNFINELNKIIDRNNVDTLVVGMPRNMSGEKTKQSALVEEFVANNLSKLNLKLVYQDESLTSVAAEQILEQRGGEYSKSDIDTVAASLILEDYVNSLRNK